MKSIIEIPTLAARGDAGRYELPAPAEFYEGFAKQELPPIRDGDDFRSWFNGSLFIPNLITTMRSIGTPSDGGRPILNGEFGEHQDFSPYIGWMAGSGLGEDGTQFSV